MESPELVIQAQKKYYDSLLIKKPCPTCKGTGHIFRNAAILVIYSHNDRYSLDIEVVHCEECHGNGYTYIEEEPK